MNQITDTFFQPGDDVFTTVCHDMRAEQLEQQLVRLNEWKLKATIQLEYFRAACRLYNFCDVRDINKLLNEE